MKVGFHLPDFAGQFKLNFMFSEMLKNRPDFFREGVYIASFYGVFPPALWNGGRPQASKSNYDKNFIKSCLKVFNEKDIPLRFTFTNMMLEKKHLSDERCNMMLALANNGLNEAIVASPVLEDYIRRNYPKYRLTSSTCKRITDPEKLAEELEKDYYLVVVDYDLNNRFDILEKLPHKEKCEFLINACCEPGCKRRLAHYLAIGKQQIAYCEHIKKYPNVPFDLKKYDLEDFSDCPFGKRGIFDIKGLSTHISPDDIWEKYVPMGFDQFKIEGRTANTLNIMETYMYYMIRPECRDEARFTLLRSLENTGAMIFT